MNEPFFCAQLFDREGYLGCVIGSSPEEVRTKIAERTNRVKTVLAASLPFPGNWTKEGLRDVTMPADWKPDFSHFDRAED